MRYLVFGAIASLLLLTGCGIGGIWLDPGNAPRRPRPPFLAHWIKDGMTKESRRDDSWACGAGPTTFSANFARPPEELLNGKLGMEWQDTLERFTKQWIVCMKSKGYVHLEKCDAQCLFP